MAFDLEDEELKATRDLFFKKEKKAMVLPHKNNKVKMSDVELGTAYDINKNLVKKYEKEISQEQFLEKYSIYQEYLQNNQDQYYMLLCNEEKDYTMFILKNDDKVIDSKEFSFNELKECLYNRGKIYGFDITEDKMAIEIWLEKDDGMHCYYFFKYGEGVIEC